MPKTPKNMGLPAHRIDIGHAWNAEEYGNRPKSCTSVNQKPGIDFGQRTLIMRTQINVGWIHPAVYVLCCVYTLVVDGDAHMWLELAKERNCFICMQMIG